MTAAEQGVEVQGQQRVRESAARYFMAAHRSRRDMRPTGYVPELNLSTWCAWEEAERSVGLSIARLVAVGMEPEPEELAVFRLIGQRIISSRARYLARERARREGS